MVARADLEVVLRATDRATPSVKNLQSTIIRFVGAVSAALAGLSAIAFPVAQAAAFERELRNVQKTTGFVDAEIELLGKDLVALSRGLVVSASDLAEIAATAGQLGLGREGRQAVVAFTASVARASIALDLANEAAAKAGARILNIFQLDTSQLENVFATVNELSNTTTANAAQVLDVISRIGPIAGLAFQQVAALGATALDLGVTQEVAGTALVKVFSRIQADAGKFAEALGISIGEFIGQGAEERFRVFLDFLSKQSEVTRAELTRTLAGSGRIFSLVNKFVEDANVGFTQFNRNIATANQSFLEGTSAIEEYDNVAQALTNQVQLLKNNFNALALDIGGQLIDDLKAATKELIKFLNTDKAKEFAAVVGKQFADTVNAIVDFVTGLKDLNLSFQNFLATIKLFLAAGLLRVLVGIIATLILATNATGKFTVKLLAATRGAVAFAASLLAVGVNALRAAKGVQFLGVATNTLVSVAGGPLGVILKVVSLIFTALAAVTFFGSDVFKTIREFFGFVTEEESKLTASEAKRLATLAKERKEAASEFRKVVELSAAGEFAIDPDASLDFSQGITEFTNQSTKAVANVLTISKGLVAGRIELERMVERRAEITALSLKEDAAVDSAIGKREELRAIQSKEFADGKGINFELARQAGALSKIINNGQARLEQLAKEDDALKVIVASTQEVIGSAGKGLTGQLQGAIDTITTTFSAAEVGAFRLNLQLELAKRNQKTFNDEIKELSGTIAAGAGDKIGELTGELAVATTGSKLAGEEIKRLEESVRDTGDTIGQVAVNQVNKFGEVIANTSTEDLPKFIKQMEILEKSAGATGKNTEELGKQIVAMAADLVILEAQKDAIGEIGAAAKDAAKTAKGVFDNTARSIRAFRRQVGEASRDLDTLLVDRVIDLRIRRRNSEFDKRVEEAEKVREDITLEFQEKIDNARNEAEKIYLNRRREVALDAIKTEIEQVESERAFLEEKVLKDRFKRLQERVANFLTAAKAAAKAGDIDEALGLKQAAQDAAVSLGDVIGSLQELEQTDPFGNISFRVTEDEIRALLKEFSATEKSVSAAIPAINKDLRDATQDAAKAFEDAEARIAEELKDLNEEIAELGKEVPNLRKILEDIGKDLKNSDAFARLQARIASNASIDQGTLRGRADTEAGLEELREGAVKAATAFNRFETELGARALAQALRGIEQGDISISESIEEGQKRILKDTREIEALRKQGRDVEADAVEDRVIATREAIKILREEARIRKAANAELLANEDVAAILNARGANDDALNTARIILNENRAQLNKLLLEIGQQRPSTGEQQTIDELKKVIKTLETGLGQDAAARAIAGVLRPRVGAGLPGLDPGAGGRAVDDARAKERAELFGDNAIRKMIEANKAEPFKTELVVKKADGSAPADVEINVLGAKRGGFLDRFRGTIGTAGVRGARGGLLRGAGSGTSDSIPALLSNGEYVIDAFTTRMMGSKFFATLQALARSGRKMKGLPKFATGGLVGSLGSFEPVVQAAGVGGVPVHIHLPGGDTMKLQEGEDTVNTIKRTMNREARKRGRRLR